MITENEVLQFQQIWGEGIISIGNTFKNGGDYQLEARDFITSLYAYESEVVFFKPTLAADTQFRFDYIAALSYFIGGNLDFPEDTGFAVKGWNSVRWKNAGIKMLGNFVVCMGNYFFGIENEEELKVEYTILLKKIDGDLKIILHDSHLPYKR